MSNLDQLELGVTDTIPMLGLSLWQPYANLVASGHKTLETRVWTTKHRGDVLICASARGKLQPTGVALCVVRVTNVRPMTTSDENAACIKLYPGAYVWELSNLRVLARPFPVKGRQRLFRVEVDRHNLDFVS